MTDYNPFAYQNVKEISQSIVNDKGEFLEQYLNTIEKVEYKARNRSGPSIQWIRDIDRVTDVFEEKTGVSTLTKALEGWEEGVVVLAGHANAGKSTFIQACKWGILQDPENEDVIVVDISLDDPASKRWEQDVATLSQLTYSQIHQLGGATTHVMERYSKARDTIVEYVKNQRYWPFNAYYDLKKSDGNIRSTPIGEFPSLQQMLEGFSLRFPEKKIVVFVDAWQDVHLNTSEQQKIDEYIQTIKRLCDKLGIRMFGSAHFRKVSGSEPDYEDIRGSKELVYVASAIFILRNDYRERQGDSTFMHEMEDMTIPIIRVEIPKNKVGAEDRMMLYGLINSCSTIVPFTEREYIKYSMLWSDIQKQRFEDRRRSVR